MSQWLTLTGGESEQAGQFSEDLDVDTSQPAVRVDDHPIDQAAHDGGCLQPRFLVGGQGAGKLTDLPPIILGNAGVEGNDRQRVDLTQLGLQPVALFACRCQNSLDLDELICTTGNRLNQPVDLGDGLVVPLGDTAASLGAVGGPARIFLMVFAHEDRYQFRIEHPLLQSGQHAPFKLFGADGAVVATAVTVAVARTAPPLQPDHCPGAAADAALAHAREQPAGPLLLAIGNADDSPSPHLYGLPQVVWHDAQFGDRLAHPFAFGIGLDAFDACAWVGHLAGAVVDEHPGVEPVLQHPVLALAVAVDRADTPTATMRAGDAFLVEPLGDLAGADIGRIFAENAPDDFGLVLVDLTQAANKVAIGIEPIGAAVAIGQTRRRPARLHCAALPALDLGTQLLAELRVHQAFESCGDLGHLPVGQGEQPRTGVDDALADGECIALMAGNAVGRLGQHLIYAARLDPLKQGIEARPGVFVDPRSAADGVIGEDIDDLPALPLAPLAQQGNLVFDGAAILQRGTEAGVEDGAHGSSPFCAWQEYPGRRWREPKPWRVRQVGDLAAGSLDRLLRRARGRLDRVAMNEFLHRARRNVDIRADADMAKLASGYEVADAPLRPTGARGKLSGTFKVKHRLLLGLEVVFR